MHTDNVHSWLASIVRLGRGMRASSKVTEPAQPIEIYEFEACPFCRKVREVLSEIDIDYVCYPCGKGSRHRQVVKELGGQAMFPYMVDPNTGTSMYESEDIITYLLETYGTGRATSSRVLSPLNTLGSALASVVRPRGRTVSAEVADRPAPTERLILYNFEASPYCRKVREALCELDLEHLVHNVGKRGRRRSDLIALGGKMRVPFLVDPNTETQMYESDDIVDYLHQTYG